MRYPEIPHIKRNPSLEGMFCLKQNVTYSEAAGEALKLTMILPWNANHPEIEKKPLPLLVFVQGSAFTTPNFDSELPQLAYFARLGFVAATVGHRDSSKGHPFPAYLQDVKCAIRYLRKHAEEYNIDPQRVVIWGTSSGGNTALLVGLTGDDPRYETPEHAGYSDTVNAVVSCFGPTDMLEMGNHMIHAPEAVKGLKAFFGTAEDGKWQEVAREMSPYYQAEAGKTYPPFLLLHGNADKVVDYEQMVKMYHKLLDCKATVDAYQVDGARHEYDFWSEEILQIIRNFICKAVK